jgi:hypothetical protein
MIDRVVGASEIDIRLIVHELSRQNRAEAKAMGLSMETIIEGLSELARRGYSEVGFVDGRPVAAFGLNDDPSGQYGDTWFIATDEIFKLSKQGIRFGRDVLASFREVCGKPLRSTSHSPLPEARHWFLILGFEEDPTSVDGRRVFVYK